MSNIDDLAILTVFIEALESLSIDYAIGGSIASSAYGYVRFTQDADIAAAAFDEKIPDFCDKLSATFYLSEDAIRQAHLQESSFNVIHLDTAFKIDVFICRSRPFDRQILSRRRKLVLDEAIQNEVNVVSPEDIILLKLQWYKDGGEVSDRQWNDSLSVQHGIERLFDR